MNSEQIRNLWQGALVVLGPPLTAFLVQVFGLPSDKVKVSLDFFGAVIPFAYVIWIAWKSSTGNQVKSVAALPAEHVRQALEQVPDAVKVQIAAAVPDVARIVVKPTATNGLAAAAADIDQPKVVEQGRAAMAPALSLLASAVLLAMALGGGLVACASTGGGAGGVDQAAVDRALNRAELGYKAATTMLVVYCASLPTTPPCNNTAAMAEIDKARAVLEGAWPRLRANIAAARDGDALTIATSAALDAIAVYAKVLGTYGVK